MQEIVHRRYKRLALAKIEDPTATLPFPDLIIIDGGAQQLRFAKEALDELDLDIPIIGLAKKQEELYFPKKAEPAQFDKNSEMMKLFRAARDEAHRFAITYQRLLRSKKATQ